MISDKNLIHTNQIINSFGKMYQILLKKNSVAIKIYMKSLKFPLKLSLKMMGALTTIKQNSRRQV